ncbi:hypothetical protein [Vibrio campbellii]|uniref:hypothetical protein n=1 Tax=Vibrio campbellii TaxID=680 RepID=UPI00168D92DD|nr:hypothetical protein [Vibrio campbellii]HDM8205980.1 hypothetical protein [Vibrio campbellii]
MLAKVKDILSRVSRIGYISDLSFEDAVATYIRLLIEPLYLSAVFGLLLFKSDGKWASIFKVSILEFMQFNGIQLVFFSTCILLSICFIFHPVTRWLPMSFIKNLVKSLNHAGFGMCAILAGVFIGISVAAAVLELSITAFLVKVVFVLCISGMFSTFFYILPRWFIVHDDVAEFSHDSKLLTFLLIGFGLFLLGISLWAFGFGNAWVVESEQC